MAAAKEEHSRSHSDPSLTHSLTNLSAPLPSTALSFSSPKEITVVIEYLGQRWHQTNSTEMCAVSFNGDVCRVVAISM